MEILFFRYSLLNRGGDRMVIEYANHLAESGHSVTILASLDETVFKLSPRIKRRRVPWPGQAGFLAYALFHRFSFDAVIVDIVHLTPLVRCAGKIVYFAQADDVEYYGNALQRTVIDQLYRRYFSSEGLSISVSAHLTEMFQSRYGAKNCQTVGNGIDLETFYPQPDEDLRASKQGRKALFFMARGDLYRKGLDLALEVFAQLSVRVKGSLELWVCGDCLEENYSFPVKQFGIVDDDRLRQILSSVDLFFYPSRHEGFGLFPLEAMACGSVVVTTAAVPYARRFSCIHTANIGNVVEMVSIVEGLLSDPGQMERDRQRGFEVAASFDLKTSKVAFCQALQEMVG